MKHKWKTAWKVFATFFKIGAFTFGGGYAMIPLIQRETVDNHKWVTEDDILEIIAIAESTPGPIAINSATFVGYRTCALWGMYQKNKKNWVSYTVMAGSFLLTAVVDVSVLPVLAGCAVFGLVTAKIMEGKVQA